MEPAEGSIATGATIEFDAASGAYRVSLEAPTEDSVAVVVPTAVATVRGVDHTALPAVDDVVDPEAIDRVLDSADGASEPTGVEVAFTYAGYRVTVRPGEAVVRPSGADLRRRGGEQSGPSGGVGEVESGSVDARGDPPTE